MGQYFLAVNREKRQYIDPHKLGGGAKLLEIAWSSGGIATALILLLRQSSEGGGGDARGHGYRPGEPHTLVGSWAGDPLALVGDYDESGLYDKAEKEFTDISADVAAMLKEND